jgi:hypothetical protein
VIQYYLKLIDYIFFMIVERQICFAKARGHAIAGKYTIKVTSSRPDFTPLKLHLIETRAKKLPC